MNILITGGASGLGEGITKALAEAYPAETIYFTYNKSSENAIRLTSTFSNTNSIKCDFTLPSDVEALSSFIDNNSIDILVNNALLNLQQQYFHKQNTASFTEGFSQNVLPVLEITRCFIVNARKKRFGKIITILSAAIANTPAIGWSSYIAEKNYLLSMHKSWAVENAGFNITSNCILPGFMETPLNKHVDERMVENMLMKHPLKKLLTVSEIAEVVLFLTKATQQMNGNNIIINSSLSI